MGLSCLVSINIGVGSFVTDSDASQKGGFCLLNPKLKGVCNKLSKIPPNSFASRQVRGYSGLHMSLTKRLGLGLAIVFSVSLFGQLPDATTTAPPVATSIATIHRRAVDPQNVYLHIITVVPFTGKGTYSDPKRPMYLPAERASATSRTDIIAFEYLPSDDGKSAIVEYVGVNKAALQQIYSDTTLTIFQKGVHSQAVIEAAMQKYRRWIYA